MHAELVHKIVKHVFSPYKLGVPLYGLSFYKNYVMLNGVRVHFTVYFDEDESNSTVYIRVQRIKSLVFQDLEKNRKIKCSGFCKMMQFVRGLLHVGKR